MAGVNYNSGVNNYQSHESGNCYMWFIHCLFFFFFNRLIILILNCLPNSHICNLLNFIVSPRTGMVSISFQTRPAPPQESSLAEERGWNKLDAPGEGVTLLPRYLEKLPISD